jgi:hypothetical protein
MVINWISLKMTKPLVLEHMSNHQFLKIYQLQSLVMEH